MQMALVFSYFLSVCVKLFSLNSLVLSCCACQATVNEVEFCKRICGLQSYEYRKSRVENGAANKNVSEMDSPSDIYTDLCMLAAVCYKSSMVIENWNGHFLSAYCCSCISLLPITCLPISAVEQFPKVCTVTISLLLHWWNVYVMQNHLHKRILLHCSKISWNLQNCCKLEQI